MSQSKSDGSLLQRRVVLSTLTYFQDYFAFRRDFNPIKSQRMTAATRLITPFSSCFSLHHSLYPRTTKLKSKGKGIPFQKRLNFSWLAFYAIFLKSFNSQNFLLICGRYNTFRLSAECFEASPILRNTSR